MKPVRYKELLMKIEDYIQDDYAGKSVSPTSGSPSGLATGDALLLSNDMDLERLSKDELMLAHTLLHKFYGRIEEKKDLTKKDIEKLHMQIKDKIPHKRFDRLDDIEK